MYEICECLDRLDCAAKTIEWINPDNAVGVSNDILAFVESLLHIQICEDIKKIFKRHNGLFIGLKISTLEECILSTLQCRETYTDRKRYRKLKDSLVISNDGSGNPILISKTGQIYLFHHEDITFEAINDSIVSIFNKHIQYLETHQLSDK